MLRLFPHGDANGGQTQNTDLDSLHLLDDVGGILLATVTLTDVGGQNGEWVCFISVENGVQSLL
jgi:hypothetical protein